MLNRSQKIKQGISCVIKKDINYIDSAGIPKIIKAGRVLYVAQLSGSSIILRLGNRMFIVQEQEIEPLEK